MTMVYPWLANGSRWVRKSTRMCRSKIFLLNGRRRSHWNASETGAAALLLVGPHQRLPRNTPRPTLYYLAESRFRDCSDQNKKKKRSWSGRLFGAMLAQYSIPMQFSEFYLWNSVAEMTIRCTILLGLVRLQKIHINSFFLTMNSLFTLAWFPISQNLFIFHHVDRIYDQFPCRRSFRCCRQDMHSPH